MLSGTTVPETPEWDKAMAAQAHAETLMKFIVWLQYHKSIDVLGSKSVDELLAEFFDIDIEMLMMEEELWGTYHEYIRSQIDKAIF